jgi:hypothetical protein
MSIISRTRRTVKPSRVAPQRSAFGEGILEPRVARHAGEYRPTAEEFAPSLEDRDAAEAMFRPVSEGPGFVGALQIAASRFRNVPGEFNRFVAAELDRLAFLAVAIGATDPTDFYRKRDLAEMDAREAWEARGFDRGLEYARGELDVFDGRID